MNRRGFFATLAAAFAARFAPKPKELKPGDRFTMPVRYGLFNPKEDIRAQWLSMPVGRMEPLTFHRDAFVLSYPRIGDTITVQNPRPFVGDTMTFDPPIVLDKESTAING